ncbi:site-specific integrase [Paraburkholderia dipogonis]|uniref:Site-specific integrase n=1 Tax=Paraburkholderia dipogonis TaxID=1211383 RepID=A0A4Y8NB47_9BURK|nr:site-specific integrase [Paraburkholderia dipogonis]TFE46922.1 site-specific integrase [Paraburkholderia dipogonis]
MTKSNTLSEIRKSIALHGVPKSTLKQDRRVVITSVGTERVTGQAERRFLEWREENGLALDGPYLRVEVVEFLQDYAELHEQSNLDATRIALGRLLSMKLSPVASLIETVRQGRATRWDEVTAIAARQREHNALSTLIANDAGLRAIELFALRRADEQTPSAHCNWPATMFLGRHDVVVMIVTGKGGLRRPIALARCLAEELEKRRRPEPVIVVDRGVHYESYYDIAGGQAFSQSFSDASQRALGASTGAHGLRHAYAQRRVRELMALGYEFMAAIQLVSRELGHFRPIFAYYQPR